LTFVQREEFVRAYPRTQTAGQFVAALLSMISQQSGVDLASERGSLVSLYDDTDVGRAEILRRCAENAGLINAEYNRSFVLTQYFGYLRRDPDQGGLEFWLGRLNSA